VLKGPLVLQELQLVDQPTELAVVQEPLGQLEPQELTARLALLEVLVLLVTQARQEQQAQQAVQALRERLAPLERQVQLDPKDHQALRDQLERKVNKVFKVYQALRAHYAQQASNRSSSVSTHLRAAYNS